MNLEGEPCDGETDPSQEDTDQGGRNDLQECENDSTNPLNPDDDINDADGDGIRNEMERAASTGLNLFDPFSADSTPSDVDFDTIPDVLDDDNDNDGWPDEVEIERNSNHLDSEQTPLNQYFGFQTGIIYHGGFTFDDVYDEGEIEISLSWKHKASFFNHSISHNLFSRINKKKFFI